MQEPELVSPPRARWPQRVVQRLVHELRLAFLALQFLTRIPVPRWVGFEPVWLQQCARHFPAVGALVGAASALVLWAAAPWLGLPAAVLMAMAASLWMTGAFHEDGLADTSDALGGAVPRARALEIMKDSRIGTYGAVALWLALTLKAVLVFNLAAQGLMLALAALPLAHAWSRVAPLVVMWALPYGGDAAMAKAKPLALQIGWPGLGVAFAWSGLAAAGAWTLGLPIVAMAAAALALVPALAAIVRWLRLRLGGFTGDTLGAAQQLSELLIYAALCVALGGAGTGAGAGAAAAWLGASLGR